MKVDRRRQILAGTGILVALAVMGLKYLAYLRTGSVALYADALESIVNVLTAVIALWAVSYSARPPDRNHPFGHHKAEYFSAVLEGVLVVVAALAILREAVSALMAPAALTAPLDGLGLSAVATAANLVWAVTLVHLGRRWRAPALVASGWHVATDVASSVPVIIGVFVAIATGWRHVDPVLAVAVAGVVLWSGWSVVKESASGLMDEAARPAELETIRDVISKSADGALEIHDLRTRVAGAALFVEFHLVVPAAMTVSAAHAICDRLESEIVGRFEGARVLIHVEPEDEAIRTGVPVV